MPPFDWISGKSDLFEDLSQTSLKNPNQLTDDDTINYFHSLMRGDTLQAYKNINSPTREKMEEFQAVFRRKYVKPKFMATAVVKSQKLVFNPANQELVDFLDELQKLAKDAFGIAAITDQFIYAKLPQRLKKSLNEAQLENVTSEQFVTHLEKKIELKDLDAPDELQVNTVRQHAPNTNADCPNGHAITLKNGTLQKSMPAVAKTEHRRQSH